MAEPHGEQKGAESLSQLDLGSAFAEHGVFVFRVLRRLGVGDAAVDDAVQEVFLVAHRRWASYRPDASMRGWLFAIARRVASHHHRTARRREARLADVPPALAPATPEEVASRREAAEFVADFLDGLDPEKRAVFVGCCIEGLSVPEVSEALGVNVNTVYSRLRVAKQGFQRAVDRRKRREEREG